MVHRNGEGTSSCLAGSMWDPTRLNRELSTPEKQENFNKLRGAVDPLPHRPHQLDREAA